MADRADFWGTGLHGVVASLARRIVSGVRFPGAPPSLSQPRRSGDYARLKSERTAFDPLGWHHRRVAKMGRLQSGGLETREFESHLSDQFNQGVA